MEHSLFPRKRTLLGRARGHHAERNALRNRLANQAKEAKNGPKHGHGNHHHTGEPGRQGRDTAGTFAHSTLQKPDCIENPKAGLLP